MSNPLIEDFISMLSRRYAEDSLEMAMSVWIERNTTLRGNEFSFKGYEFQRKIVDDMHPDLSCIKCSQVGLTEVQLRKFLGFLHRNRGVAAIFSLPDENLFKRVSQTRLQPILQKDAVFNLEQDEKAVRSMSTIQIGQSFGYITKCTEGDATSTSADALFHDEVDLSDRQMLSLYQSRLQNSNWKITQRFSTPTFTNYGIDQTFKISDQQEYMCRCTACQHWNAPRFTRTFVHIDGLPDDLEDLSEISREQAEKMDLLNAYVRCERCQARLDLGNPELREWVPAYPTRTLARGYRVTPFCTSRLTLDYIVNRLLKAKDDDYLKGWFNTVLGEPYIDSNSRLSEEDILACMLTPEVPDVSRDRPTFIGIDVGQTCHITMLTGTDPENASCFLFETVHANHLEQRVKELLSTYRIVAGAVDRHPYTPTADALRDISKGVILPTEYRGASPINFVKDEFGNITHAQVNRTNAIDATVRLVRAKTLKMAGYGHQRTVVIEHLRDMVRDEKPDEPAKWVKLNGNDHYLHALVMAVFSMRLRAILDNSLEVDPRTIVGFMGTDLQKTPGGLLVFRNGKNISSNNYSPLG